MSEILPDPLSLHKDENCSSAQMQEFNDVRGFLKIHYKKYSKYKILHEAAEDTLMDVTGLDPELKEKVQDIVLGHSCAQTTELESDHCDNLLGLPDVTNRVLSYNESLKLTKALVTVLEKKSKDVCETFSKVFGEDVNTVLTINDFGDLNLSATDAAWLELRRQVEQEQKRYLQYLVQEQTLLEKLVVLRLERLREVCGKKISECQVKSRIAALRFKMIKDKSRLDCFNATSNSLAAYKNLMDDIKEQQEKCQRDIQYLEQQKTKYSQVACREYSDILKSYIEFKSSMEKKKLLLDSLHS